MAAREASAHTANKANREAVLTRRIRLLVAATISYNVIEAVVAISAGTIASSTALIGFGLDSVIEVSSAAAVAWQFSGRDPKSREKKALRLIAIAFFALAAFVTVGAVRSLLGAGEAEHSTVGIVLAAVSLAVMPFLSLAQRRAGRELGSRSAVADSRQTLLCTYLSGVLLLGLVLNSTLGWSWADPVAALVIAAVAVKEGLDAWKGESCCAPAPPASTRAGQRTTTAAPASGTDAPAAGLLIVKKAGDGADACGWCQDAAAQKAPQTAAPGQPRPN
ncbi:cation transporter [Arthrobacter sp. AK04]|uniref:cation transporter n=1 Tax=Arthrobacter sp. AK04 TaxID=2900048 RepID=UPI001E5B81F5|nr:cation transporter [Arthrobacter sp. AK04]MCD5344063.1 cation transporter [Arthrobacter sp. AK04]